MTTKLIILLSAAPAVLALVRPDGVGKLPALGWNSWNAFMCDISEEKFLTAAQQMVSLGLKDAGYQYVNVDDCWSVKPGRDPTTNRLVPDRSKFPDGISGTAAKVHDMGLKMGIYSSSGTETCAGYPGSIGHESIDAETFAEWGIDYLKYDNCNFPSNWTDECDACYADWFDSAESVNFVNGTCTNTTGLCPPGYDYSQSNTAQRFRIMRDALEAQDRTILYSICEWGYAGVQQWGNATGNSWRATNDINANWDRIVQIVNENSFYLHSTDFWGHSDADMLEIGNGDLTYAESRSHFALWAAMKSPILIGTALDKLSQDLVEILKNKYLLAFHQDDSFGPPAMPYKWGTNPDWTFNASFPAEYWCGWGKDGTLVLMFNPADGDAEKTAAWSEVPGLDGGQSYNVVNVWTGQDLGCIANGVTVTVSSHDTAALLVQGACGSQKRGERYREIRWTA